MVEVGFESYQCGSKVRDCTHCVTATSHCSPLASCVPVQLSLLCTQLALRHLSGITSLGNTHLLFKNLPANAGNVRDVGSILGWEDPLVEAWQPTPGFLPGESRGQRSLMGYNPWDHKGLDTAEVI